MVINNNHCYSEPCQTLTTWHQDAKHYNVMLVKIFLFISPNNFDTGNNFISLKACALLHIFTLTKNKSKIDEFASNVQAKLDHVQGNLKHLKWVSSCYKTIYCQ